MSELAWELTTRTGLKIFVRAVTQYDDPIMNDLFHHVKDEDLRFRFLSGRRSVSAKQVHDMTHVDHQQTETYIALVEGTKVPVATAMLAHIPGTDRGEVAISVHADYKNCGIGWELLAFTARQAKARGIKAIESIESRANHEAIELEKDMGFVARDYPGDTSLVLVSKQL